jgi:hypothetical protein
MIGGFQAWNFFFPCAGGFGSVLSETWKSANTILTMPEKPAPVKKLSDKNTKQEMLELKERDSERMEPC